MLRDSIAIFVFSLLALALEILLTRVISVILGPNFVYLIIGMAILGFSGAGAFVAYKSRKLSGTGSQRPAFYATAFAYTLVPSILLICFLTPRLGAEMKIGIGLVSCLTALPFFFAGMVVVSILSSRTEQIGRFYGLNLAGSGLGCFIPIIGLHYLSGGLLLIFLAITATLALFILPSDGSRLRRAGVIGLNLALLFLFLRAGKDASRPEYCYIPL